MLGEQEVVTSKVTCNCERGPNCKKALSNNESYNNMTKGVIRDIKCNLGTNQPDKTCDEVMIAITTSPINPISRTAEIKWILQLAIVMYGMAFNGTIYGYTSPAFPSLVSNSIGVYHH